MKIRLLPIILALVMIVSVMSLTACNNNTPDNTDPFESSSSVPGGESNSGNGFESQSGTDTEPSEITDLTEHKIIADGKANYALIRYESLSKTVISEISELYKELVNLSDGNVIFTTDWSVEYIKNNKQHDEKAYEIVIGDTNYEQSAKIKEGLSYGDYRIDVSGRKIFIVAWSDEGLIKAVRSFSNLLTKKYDSNTKSVTLKNEDFVITKTFNSTINKLPVYEDASNFNTYDCGNDCDMLIFNKTSAEGFEKYTKNLNDKGFKEYARNSMNNNLFATYTDDKTIVNVIYSPYNKQTRVIYESYDYTSLPQINAPEYKKICDSLLIQVGVSPDKSIQQNGECYLIRLENGSFIIYDGGFKANNSGEQARDNSERILNTLIEYSPDILKSKPRIAAWIFTHGHGDHNGAFITFAKNYSKRVTIDSFIINAPAAEQIATSGSGPSITNQTELAMFTYFGESAIVKAHPGQYFNYANIKIEVLYSLEMFAPNQLTYFNTSSVVTRLTINGQTIIMTGDMSPDATPIICSMYRDFLKADFVQVAHHGYQGANSTFYKLVDPTWALWPVGAGDIERLKANARNEYLISSKNIKDIYVAEFNTFVFSLPFDGTNYVKYPNK